METSERKKQRVILVGDVVLAILGKVVPRVWIVEVVAIHDNALLVTVTGDHKVWVERDHILGPEHLDLVLNR